MLGKEVYKSCGDGFRLLLDENGREPDMRIESAVAVVIMVFFERTGCLVVMGNHGNFFNVSVGMNYAHGRIDTSYPLQPGIFKWNADGKISPAFCQFAHL